MFIQTQETPNPNTLKFLPGVQLLISGTRNYVMGDDISSAPLAMTLFNVSGVEGVFIGTDFVSVTKNNENSWEVLKPLLLAAIMDHLLAGMPVVLDTHSTEAITYSDDITKQIVEIIETRVRPAVAADGGDIIFDRFEDGIVYVVLQGACSGCPSSQFTLKSGIENMLKHYVPEVQAVEAV